MGRKGFGGRPMTTQLLLSILVPTFHRPEGVKLFLQSLAQQHDSLEDSEILIINNAPEDQELISQICTEFSSQGLPVRALLQPIKGVSHARNLGIEKARGKWLVFFDDDEELEENYLSSLLTLLGKSEENTILGGPYEAVFDGIKPIWVKNEYFNINLGPETRPLESGKYLWGGNLILTAALAKEAGLFDQKLGYVGAVRHSFGEDTEFLFRAVQKGGKQIYCPQLVVRHHIQEGRYHLQAFCHRRKWTAFSKALLYIRGLSGQNKPHDLKFRLYHAKVAFLTGFSMIGLYLSLPFRDRETFPYHEQFVVEKILPAYYRFWFNVDLFRIK
jgi:glycosyltransferase involved in cell wall biosynthesis